MSGRRLSIVMSCEHGGCRVPPEYRALFRGKQHLLDSHRGWDPGARAVAERLARTLSAPLIVGKVTRLVVDLNRAPDSPTLWSEWTRDLSRSERSRILRRYYTPYRRAVRSLVQQEIGSGARVLHVSVHSFTPVLRGQRRSADIGLLFDPSRTDERRKCAALRARLRVVDPRLVVRANYPYRGVEDAMTTALRAELDPRRYSGIEIEMNQKLSRRPEGVARLARALGHALSDVVSV